MSACAISTGIVNKQGPLLMQLGWLIEWRHCAESLLD